MSPSRPDTGLSAQEPFLRLISVRKKAVLKTPVRRGGLAEFVQLVALAVAIDNGDNGAPETQFGESGNELKHFDDRNILAQILFQEDFRESMLLAMLGDLRPCSAGQLIRAALTRQLHAEISFPPLENEFVWLLLDGICLHRHIRVGVMGPFRFIAKQVS